MLATDKEIFDAIRTRKGSALTQDEVNTVNAIMYPATSSGLTPRAMCFTASEEGLVQEAYLDSVNVWTAFLGVTNASGHEVYPRYKDAPQDMQKCVDVSVWLMREKYLPDVLAAFDGYTLKEHELAAALSFHWNTGAIKKTDWVKMVKAGDRSGARKFLETHYLNNGTLDARRKREAALFFDAKWPASMLVPVYPVAKPSYKPAWGKAKSLDIMLYLEKAL